MPIQYEVYNYGVLEVDGTLSTSGSDVYNDIGTLQGTGTINALDVSVYNYGTLIPGTASLPGILTTNNIDFESGGNFNVLLNGDATAGTDYDQLDVTRRRHIGRQPQRHPRLHARRRRLVRYREQRGQPIRSAAHSPVCRRGACWW